jgi:roadblock/LC7 domain-containing protein
LKTICGVFLIAFLCLGLTLPCFAQELEPRLWSHLPIGTNFAGGAYAHTEADISFDPVLRLENVEMDLDTWAVKYIRSFGLFEKTARIEFTQGFQEGQWTGRVDGVPSSIKRSGLSDAFLRFAINLYGTPPLKGKEYAAYRAGVEVETIAGIALAVQLPTGDYMDDKLINLGTNRFTFRPQVGVVHTRGKWSMEVTGAVWIFTENDEFFNGNTLEQDPLYTVQAHIIHTFRPGIWAGASVGYGYGGESTVNGLEKNDRKGNLAWAFSFSYPIMRQLAVKVAYIGTRTQEATGLDSDSIAVGFSTFW